MRKYLAPVALILVLAAVRVFGADVTNYPSGLFSVTGALKGNGSGVITQAACADLSNAAASCSTNTTSATNISSGTLASARLAYDSAVLGGTAVSGTGTASTTAVMMGYGATCKLTPAVNTRVLVGFTFGGANNTSSDSFAVQLAFGTGTAPVNGAASTGTGLGSELALGGGSNANAIFGGAENGVITGLSPGTAYWFDIRLRAIGGGTATLTGAECWAIEM